LFEPSVVLCGLFVKDKGRKKRRKKDD